MDWYVKVLKNYATFSGRARRTEYWMFVLINFIVTAVLYGMSTAFKGGALGGLFTALYVVYAIGVIVPGLAVFFRRMHDTGRSGWWWLLGFIPVIGAIVLIVFAATEGTPGANGYGADPKAVEGATPATA